MALYNFQQRAIDFAIEKKRCLLHMATGTGKTNVAIQIAKKLAEEKTGAPLKVLYFCPAHLVPTVFKQIDEWYPSSEFINLPNGARINMRRERAARIGVLSYTSHSREKNSKKTADLLDNFKPDMVVLDECHKLKSWEACTTKRVIFEHAVPASVLVAMTATPYINSAMDYHPVFSAIQPGQWGKRKEFGEKYCFRKPDPWKKVGDKYYGVQNPMELAARMQEFTFRVTQEQAAVELPKKVRTNIWLQIPSQGAAFEDFTEDDTQDDDFQRVWLETSLAKVPGVVEWVREEMEHNPNILIFAHHHQVLDKLSSELRCMQIDGDTDLRQRERIIIDFMSNRYRQPLVISHGVGREGLNLQAANTVVHAQLPLTYTDLVQTDGRVHRLGQSEKTVYSYRFIAENSIDEVILQMLDNKAAGAAATCGAYE